METNERLEAAQEELRLLLLRGMPTCTADDSDPVAAYAGKVARLKKEIAAMEAAGSSNVA